MGKKQPRKKALASADTAAGWAVKFPWVKVTLNEEEDLYLGECGLCKVHRPTNSKFAKGTAVVHDSSKLHIILLKYMYHSA